MQAAGYETKFCGKYLNGYGDGQASSVPPGKMGAPRVKRS